MKAPTAAPTALSARALRALGPDFVWGVAASAYQIEGGVQADGRGLSIWDTFSHTPGKTARGETGDVACDHYRLWREDVALMADLGVDAYRFSIAWPRVQPQGHGAWNAAGLDFYERLVDALLAKGIQPHATLYHWDLPQGLQDRGGWGERETALRFAEYAAQVGQRLGDRLAALVTHNEPWCTAVVGHETGRFAPGLRDAELATQVSHHLLLSHGLALQALRAEGVRCPLGIVLNQWSVTPATESDADAALARTQYAAFVRWYMDPLFGRGYPHDAGIARQPRVESGDMQVIAQPLDFLGINYYTRLWASSEGRLAPMALGATDMGWEIYPEGLLELLCGLAREYTLPPIYITENGIACADAPAAGRVEDHDRIDFVRRHLEMLAAARDERVDVRGYFYWSLLDNFEWDSGYAKRFGLVHVDYATQRRTPKASAHWYRDTARAARAAGEASEVRRV